MTAWLRSLFTSWRIRENSLVAQLVNQWRIRNAVIDPNSKCPACGARSGKLKAVFVEKDSKPNKTVMVERTCNICEAKCYEPTIVPPDKWVSAKLLRENPRPQSQ